MTKKELGAIVKQIREQKLKMTQQELSAILDITQVTLSRFESGAASSLEILLNFLDLLREKNYNPAAIFAETFKIDLLSNNYTTNVDQITHLIEELQDQNEASLQKIKFLLSNL